MKNKRKVRHDKNNLIELATSLKGKVLDKKYIVGPILGSGTFGTVVKAYDIKAKKIVAIKIYMDSVIGWKDMFHEIKIISKGLGKECKRYLCIIDVGKIKGKVRGGITFPYLVLTYIDGIPLIKYIATVGFSNVPKIYENLKKQIKHLHSLGVAHQDIKHENILITSKGPKIIDFGLSCLSKHKGFCKPSGTRTLMPKAKLKAHNQGKLITKKLAQYSDLYALSSDIKHIHNLFNFPLPKKGYS